MSSSTFRFVHAADLHLDAPFHGLRRASPAVTQALGQATLKAWDALVQLTIDQNAAFLLLAGDICDGGERGIPAQLRLLNGLQRLSSLGIRTFIVRGAKDPVDRWSGIYRWPDGVHCFGTHGVESIGVRTAAGHIATIHGISHTNERAANRVARFRRGAEPGIHIGLLHAHVRAGEIASGEYSSVNDLQAAGLDYWALGGEHRHRQVSSNHPWIVYPGTLQGRSLKDDETGPKGAVVVSVADGTISSATHYALDAVRLTRTQIDASTMAGAGDFRMALSVASTRLRAESAARTVVAAGDIVGRRQNWMGAQLADALWDHILEDLRYEENSGDGHLWWDSLNDSTDARETWKDDDASAYVHGLVDVFRRAPAGLDRLLADHNVALGPAILAGQSTFDSIEVNDLLNGAERVALSLLEPKES
jgi:DNA repair exonuclease SbcCD nuclease subunit